VTSREQRWFVSREPSLEDLKHKLSLQLSSGPPTTGDVNRLSMGVFKHLLPKVYLLVGLALLASLCEGVGLRVLYYDSQCTQPFYFRFSVSTDCKELGPLCNEVTTMDREHLYYQQVFCVDAPPPPSAGYIVQRIHATDDCNSPRTQPTVFRLSKH